MFFSQNVLDLKLILPEIIKLCGPICCFYLLIEGATACFLLRDGHYVVDFENCLLARVLALQT